MRGGQCHADRSRRKRSDLEMLRTGCIDVTVTAVLCADRLKSMSNGNDYRLHALRNLGSQAAAPVADHGTRPALYFRK